MFKSLLFFLYVKGIECIVLLRKGEYPSFYFSAEQQQQPICFTRKLLTIDSETGKDTSQ